jgi:GNAT superfamily N-acetyltransferase
MSEMVGHDCQSSGKENEWSIHCLFVREGFRGRGVSSGLIKAAIDFAKLNGAVLISAFPIPSENRKKFPPDEAEFSGRYSSYSKLGFVSVGDASDFYQRMELKC